MVAGGQTRISEKTVSYITDVALLEQQKETTGAVQVKRILMLLVLLTGEVTGEVNVAYFQSKYWQQHVPPGCLIFPGILPLENRESVLALFIVKSSVLSIRGRRSHY